MVLILSKFKKIRIVFQPEKWPYFVQYLKYTAVLVNCGIYWDILTKKIHFFKKNEQKFDIAI